MRWKKTAVYIGLLFLCSACTMSLIPSVEASSLSEPLVPPSRVEPASSDGVGVFDIEYYGDPLVPIEFSGYNPAGFLEYSEQDHFIHRQFLHGRPVTVAWETGIESADAELRSSISSIYFDAFSSWWDVFEGFPYESYTVVLKSDPDYQNEGEYGIGYEVAGSEIMDWYEMSKEGDLDYLKAKIGHEVFHAWNNSALSAASNAEYWFREGAANYYGHQFAGLEEYQAWMEAEFDFYTTVLLGSECDFSLSEVGELLEGGSACPLMQTVYYKGALVSYMMDIRLNESGLTLDDLMRYLYVHFDYGREQISNADIQFALGAITADDWGPFFDDYVYGTAAIVLDAPFVLTER